jgi:hypothetical protein
MASGARRDIGLAVVTDGGSAYGGERFNREIAAAAGRRAEGTSTEGGEGGAAEKSALTPSLLPGHRSESSAGQDFGAAACFISLLSSDWSTS